MPLETNRAEMESEQSVRSCILCLNKDSEFNQNNYEMFERLERIVTIEKKQVTEILCHSCSSDVDEFIRIRRRNIAKMPTLNKEDVGVESVDADIEKKSIVNVSGIPVTSIYSLLESKLRDDESKMPVEAGDQQEETKDDVVAPVIKVVVAVFDINLMTVDELEKLSPLEESYINKCKAMVKMYWTLRCACHSNNYSSFKALLSHLRHTNIWFPPHTCYHCMITFINKSSIDKHNRRCRSGVLKQLMQLSNLKRRSLKKARLYQNYRCSACKLVFSFFEDFRRHVEEEHVIGKAENVCTCGEYFNSLENYKNHLYFSCMIEFFCGICTTVVKTPVEFLEHSRQYHDNAQSFSLIQANNKKRKSLSEVSQIDNEENVDVIQNDKLITPKRMRSPTECPKCGKIYSNSGNMLRHFRRTHNDNKPDISGLPEEKRHPELITNNVENVQSVYIYSCHICYITLPNEASLKHHESQYHAEHSDRTINGNDESRLNQQHSLSRTSSMNNIWPCLSGNICQEEFSSPIALRLHQIRLKTEYNHENLTEQESKPILHTQIEEDEFQCEECPLKSPNSIALKIHQIEKHQRSHELIYKCEPCGTIYNYEDYTNHRSLHEILEAKPHKMNRQFS